MKHISIIVPVYNVEQYLSRCIESILNQTFQDFELIMIDDGSTDDSPSICDKYQKKDKRISVIHQKNAGQAAARNTGVKVASCEWIHFVDSDDFIHPQMLEYLWHAVEKNDAALSVAHIYEASTVPHGFCDELRYNEVTHKIDEENMIFFQNNTYINCTPVAKLIRKSILLKYPFTEGRVYEDSAVAFKWIYESGTIIEIPLKLYFYQKNEISTTNGEFSVKKLDALWSQECQIDFYYNIGYYCMYNMLRTNYFGSFAELYSAAVENHVPIKSRIQIVWNALLIWLQRYRKHCDPGMSFIGFLFILFPGLRRKKAKGDKNI